VGGPHSKERLRFNNRIVCSSRRYIQHLAALRAIGKVRKHLLTLALKQRPFCKSSQKIRIGMRAGLLASRQFPLQRIGFALPHITLPIS
jgi:hypothetical protein